MFIEGCTKMRLRVATDQQPLEIQYHYFTAGSDKTCDKPASGRKSHFEQYYNRLGCCRLQHVKWSPPEVFEHLVFKTMSRASVRFQLDRQARIGRRAKVDTDRDCTKRKS